MLQHECNTKVHLIQNKVSESATFQIFCDYICRQCWFGSDLTVSTVRLVMSIANVFYYIPAAYKLQVTLTGCKADKLIRCCEVPFKARNGCLHTYVAENAAN